MAAVTVTIPANMPMANPSTFSIRLYDPADNLVFTIAPNANGVQSPLQLLVEKIRLTRDDVSWTTLAGPNPPFQANQNLSAEVDQDSQGNVTQIGLFAFGPGHDSQAIFNQKA